jgi:WD40 repeat protein
MGNSDIHNINQHKIQNLNYILEISNLHPQSIASLIELTDKRIATGSCESISICSINYLTKEWNQDIFIPKAHYRWVYSLCELNNNRLVSCSTDNTIKIWNYSQTELLLLATLQKHSWDIVKVIPLTENRIASCSWDTTVKVWEGIEPYQELVTLKHNEQVCSIIQSKKTKILVTSCSSPSITFWDLVLYKKKHTINKICAIAPNHMIELPNGNIAVSSSFSQTEEYSVTIIEMNNYTIVKNIQVKDFIINGSSLCVIDKNSFVYLYEGRFVQFSSIDYSILHKSDKEERLNAFSCGLITIDEGKYIVTGNNSKGITLIQPV